MEQPGPLSGSTRFPPHGAGLGASRHYRTASGIARFAGTAPAFRSPLGRAGESAAIIARQFDNRVAIVDPRLSEVTLGSWDGLTHRDIDALWPGALEGSTAFDWYFRSPNGKTCAAALARARSWLGNMDGTLIAISHGLIGPLIRGAYAGLEQAAMLALPVPQDAIWHLHDGVVDEISA
jgi:broad specificity phosphatase PhoE